MHVETLEELMQHRQPIQMGIPLQSPPPTPGAWKTRLAN
jgi:hypothetical protein